MPYTNFCRKCKAETPVGDVCYRCGTKLTRTGERLSFSVVRTPVTDFFSWNAILRIVVPVVGIVLLSTIAFEGIAEGARGVQNVIVQGFFWVLLMALAVLLLLTFVLLLLQGRETIRYTLDGKSVHLQVYIKKPHAIQIYARFLTPKMLVALAPEAQEPMGDGFTLVRHTHLAWTQVKRFSTWPETNTIFLFDPTFWQAMCIRCPDTLVFEEVLILMQKKAPRKKRGRKKRK